MIKCRKCGLTKDTNDFSYRNKSLAQRHSVCKQCTRSAVKSHYARNKDYYLTKTKTRNSMLREKANMYIKEFLTIHPCVDCGESDLRVLEFDHRKDSVKLKAVSALVRNRVDIELIKKEVAKCDVRCANCHRKKTSFDFNWFKR